MVPGSSLSLRVEARTPHHIHNLQLGLQAREGKQGPQPHPHLANTSMQRPLLSAQPEPHLAQGPLLPRGPPPPEAGPRSWSMPVAGVALSGLGQ